MIPKRFCLGAVRENGLTKKLLSELSLAAMEASQAPQAKQNDCQAQEDIAELLKLNAPDKPGLARIVWVDIHGYLLTYAIGSQARLGIFPGAIAAVVRVEELAMVFYALPAIAIADLGKVEICAVTGTAGSKPADMAFLYLGLSLRPAIGEQTLVAIDTAADRDRRPKQYQRGEYQ